MILRFYGKIRRPIFFSRTGIFALIIIGCLGFSFALYADNQLIMKNIGTSDPAPSFFNGVYYLYCTEDAVGNGDLTIYNINCYSTIDFYHWKDEGTVLPENNIPWCNKQGRNWAPHCVYFGGKYHLYVPETDNAGTFRIAHATCSAPNGKFQADARPMPNVDAQALDPFCIIDSAGGKNYLNWCIVGVTPNRQWIAELSEDGASVIASTKKDISAGIGSSTTYKEGEWQFKHNNTWYHFFADWTGPEVIKYSTASNVTGPFTNKATIMGSNINSATIHPGVCYHAAVNKWILFYHCDGSEWGGSLTRGNKRVTGAEYFTFDGSGNVSPGNIPKTKRGVGVPFFYDTIQIDRCNKNTGCSITKYNGSDTVGYVVSNINNGSVQYNQVDLTGIAGGVKARVAGTGAGNSIKVHADNSGGPLLTTIPAPNTGGASTWQIAASTVASDATVTGVKDLVVVFKGSGFSVDWIKLGDKPTGVADHKTGQAEVIPAGVRYKRISRNCFSVAFPRNNATIAEMKLLNLKGRDTKVSFMSKAVDCSGILVSFEEKSVASGAYVLKIKSSVGMMRIPFTY